MYHNWNLNILQFDSSYNIFSMFLNVIVDPSYWHQSEANCSFHAVDSRDSTSPQDFEAFQLGETTEKSPSHLMWWRSWSLFKQAGCSLSVGAVSYLMWWPVTRELPFSPPSLPYTPLALSATLSGRQLWPGVPTESSEAESQKGQGGWSPQEEKKIS